MASLHLSVYVLFVFVQSLWLTDRLTGELLDLELGSNCLNMLQKMGFTREQKARFNPQSSKIEIVWWHPSVLGSSSQCLYSMHMIV